MWKKQTAAALCMLLLLMSTALPVKALPLVGDLVDIPDTELDSALNALFPNASVDEVTSINVENTYTIGDLSGLEQFVNLNSLSMESDTITDLSPLADLTDLDTLNLQGSQFDVYSNAINQQVIYNICQRPNGSVSIGNFHCGLIDDTWIPQWPQGAILDLYDYEDGGYYLRVEWDPAIGGSAYAVTGYEVYVSTSAGELGTLLGTYSTDQAGYAQYDVLQEDIPSGTVYIHVVPLSTGLLEPFMSLSGSVEIAGNQWPPIEPEPPGSLNASLSASRTHLQQHDTVTVTASVYADEAFQMNGADIILDYNPDQFELLDVRAGSAFTGYSTFVDYQDNWSPYGENVQNQLYTYQGEYSGSQYGLVPVRAVVAITGSGGVLVEADEYVIPLEFDFKAITSGGSGTISMGPAVTSDVYGGSNEFYPIEPVNVHVESMIYVAELTLSETSLSLETTDQTSTPLSVVALPIDATYPQALTWSSDDPSVASVDQQGNVTPIGKGTTTIRVTADYGGVSAAIPVSVSVPVESIELGQEQIWLNLTDNNTAAITDYTVYPLDANEQGVSFYSLDDSIVTVSSNGELAAQGFGKTKIRITSLENAEIESFVEVFVADTTAIQISSEKAIIPTNRILLADVTLVDPQIEPVEFKIGFNYSEDTLELYDVYENGEYGSEACSNMEATGFVSVECLIGTTLTDQQDLFELDFDTTANVGLAQIELAEGSYLLDSNGIPYFLTMAEPYQIAVAEPDVNGDDKINISDLVLVASAFNASTGDDGYQPEYDMNHSGEIDILDLSLLASQIFLETPGGGPILQ